METNVWWFDISWNNSRKTRPETISPLLCLVDTLENFYSTRKPLYCLYLLGNCIELFQHQFEMRDLFSLALNIVLIILSPIFKKRYSNEGWKQFHCLLIYGSIIWHMLSRAMLIMRNTFDHNLNVRLLLAAWNSGRINYGKLTSNGRLKPNASKMWSTYITNY